MEAISKTMCDTAVVKLLEGIHPIRKSIPDCMGVIARMKLSASAPHTSARAKDMAWFFRKLRFLRKPQTLLSAISSGRNTPELVKNSMNTDTNCNQIGRAHV